jgi:hypothetical protein
LTKAYQKASYRLEDNSNMTNTQDPECMCNTYTSVSQSQKSKDVDEEGSKINRRKYNGQ